MRLLELIGSLFLIVWIIGLIWGTSLNISKYLFATQREKKYMFWARQTTIFLWPLVFITEEGREALKEIWKRSDRDEQDDDVIHL